MGSIRLARFARYLPEFGWQPRVLTVRTATAGRPYDKEMLDIIPPSVEINRVDPLFDTGNLQKRIGGVAGTLHRLLAQVPPDGELGVAWLPAAYREARRILARERIDVIFTSSPPCMAHVVGYLLKRRTGKPWVADFRDEWSLHPQRRFRFSVSARIDAWLERQVLRAADHVTTATGSYSTGLASLIADSPGAAGKFTVITNGFDRADFAFGWDGDGIEKPSEKQSANGRKFRVTYVGNLYGGIGFFTALQSLLANGGIPAERIEFHVLGQIRPVWHLDGALVMEKVSSLGPVIRQAGWVSHRDATRAMRQADLLLLVLDTNRGDATIPGKVFEYLAAGRPILGLVSSQSELAGLLKHFGCDMVVDPDDAQAIEEAICELYGEWIRGGLPARFRREEIARYDAKALAGSLAEILDGVLS